MLEFTIPIKPITKKNSMQIVSIKTKTGAKRNIIVPSKQFQKFEKECKAYVERVQNSVGTIHWAVNVKCLFYMPTRHRVDLTNLLEAVDDVLTKWALIIDDNRDVIAGHDGSRVLYDAQKPRIEIHIEEINNYEQWSTNKNG